VQNLPHRDHDDDVELVELALLLRLESLDVALRGYTEAGERPEGAGEEAEERGYITVRGGGGRGGMGRRGG